jgi:hypothetical protein
MTDLAVAAADAPAQAGPPTAAALAARIQIPRRLPIRHDGEPLRHLSNSSYTRFLLCPEDWRRHYLKGERFPATGPMFLGGSVDAALTAYYQRILDHHDALTLGQVKDLYRELWHERLAEGLVDWDDELTEPGAFQLGLDALELTFNELVPQLGTPVAAQRKLEFALAPGVEWTVQCYLDLETERIDEAGTTIPAVVDYKVKNSVHSQARANHDPQAGLYLAGRWLTGAPAREFCFAQIAKPGKRRKHMSSSLVTTRRTVGELRGTLARIAQAARQIAALYERLGPDEPWGFADPISWKCAPAYCRHHARCPGGAGL